ncbi:hypothetical protein BDP81DRAFT_90556 [Colletotrichum phormii]|uniref:Secreted protein n=1 Tax=Colletotrichum phormii TaxID=359342 RepID=A0AAJ0A4J7_9PEZI|nr:uncharacterized protein BDP81DRAFT_90556 [Colletotrichum phormii]KAK1654892.1 hypothetical protein BDP81DRAFT_90556 [Colletotrichum phormii]
MASAALITVMCCSGALQYAQWRSAAYSVGRPYMSSICVKENKAKEKALMRNTIANESSKSYGSYQLIYCQLLRPTTGINSL